MKWIVKSDFYRTRKLKNVKIVGACEGANAESPHANHIQMGTFIELGESQTESDLQVGNKDDNETKQLIAILRYSGRIGDAGDKDVVARVVADVKTANTRLERQKKASETNSTSELGDKILALLQGKLAAAK